MARDYITYPVLPGNVPFPSFLASRNTKYELLPN